MDNKSIINAILTGFEEAIVLSCEIKNHKDRSRVFIKFVHNKLTELYNSKDIVVFSKEKPNNDFNRSEFMYDIHICAFNKVTSPVHGSELPYIKESLVEIESEFAENTRESIIDFSKLVVGKAQLKIMILPNSMNGDEKEHYLEPLKNVAIHIPEKLYCIFIPHPRSWENIMNSDSCIVYEFVRGDWESKKLEFETNDTKGKK